MGDDKDKTINSIEDILRENYRPLPWSPHSFNDSFDLNIIFNQFSSSKETIKQISEFLKNESFKSIRIPLLKKMFLRFTPPEQKELLMDIFKILEIGELTELLKGISLDEELLLFLYRNKYENENIVEFIEILNKYMIYQNKKLNLFSDQDIISMLKRLENEDLYKTLKYQTVIRSSSSVQTWYEENFEIGKLSDCSTYDIGFSGLPDAEIEMFFRLAKQKDFSNISSNSSFFIFQRFLSMPGEIQDKTVEFFVDNFDWLDFVKMMCDDMWSFSEKLTESNCKKIFEQFKNNSIDLIKFLNKPIDETAMDIKLDLFSQQELRSNLFSFLSFYEKLNVKPPADEAIDFFISCPNFSLRRNHVEGLINELSPKNCMFIDKYVNKEELPQHIKLVVDFLNIVNSYYGGNIEPELLDEAKNGQLELVNFYLNFCKEYGLECLNFSLIKELLAEIKNSQIQLSENNIKNLKKIIFDGNRLNIKTFDMLANYDEIESELSKFLNATGKINTLEVNPVVDAEFIYFIFKNLGLDFSVELSKYNTIASKEIIEAIKNGEIELIKFYIDFYKKYNLFHDNDKKVNLAFLHFSSIKDLLIDIKNKQIQLKEKDINNLKNIILSGNRYNINTVDELFNYDETVSKFINDVLQSDNIDDIKNNIAKSFCSDYLTLEKIFNGYDLSNFSKLADVLKMIPKELIESEPQNYMLTSQDIKLIVLIKNIISCQDLDKLKNLLAKSSEQKIDYQSELDILLNKIKNIYRIAFNSVLTNVDNLTSRRDSSTIPGVTIVDLNGEPFNFYAHRLYNYDEKFVSYSGMLEADPSLWTKLEGASTLSASCISDKGLHFLHSKDPNGVVYLFNYIPSDGMLYMYGRDLFVEHGGHQINPSCQNNKFTDFESLIQATNYHECSYNELSVFRNGIMPCAFACIGDSPNEATIRAATHFNVPIIKLNPELYDKQNDERRKMSREDFSLCASFESLKGIFYDGTGDIRDKIEFCLGNLKSQFKDGTITYKDYVQLLAEMQKFVDKTYDKGNENYKRKIQLLRQSICIMKSLSDQEIIELETANMGESGIMYRMKDEDSEYLLKPSVEKTSLKNEPFRAEVQKAASVLQSIISPDTSVGVEVFSEGPLRISKQELIKVDGTRKNELNAWFQCGGELESNYTNQLLQEYVVDFLLCNFDCYSGNFVVDENNNVRGIDKEQSFRFIEDPQTLDPTFNYSPNGNSRIPIYSKLFEEYKAGRLDLNLDVISDCISSVETISDEDYVGIFEKYAEALNPDKKQEMLQKILKRKYDCVEILKNYVLQLQSCKGGGVKL